MYEEVAKLISEFGAGVAALCIIMVLFVYLLKETLKTNREGRKEQVDALGKVAESNNNVAQALAIIKETFVDRTNILEGKVERTYQVICSHRNDASRIEDRCDRMHEMLTQIGERTKAHNG